MLMARDLNSRRSTVKAAHGVSQHEARRRCLDALVEQHIRMHNLGYATQTVTSLVQHAEHCVVGVIEAWAATCRCARRG